MQQSSMWKLFAAFIYDLFPLLGIFILTAFIAVLFKNGRAVEPHTLWFDVLLFLELMFYYTYSWKVGGQTLGMRAWKIKIVPNSVNQATLSWRQTILRFMVGLLSTLLLGSGLFWMIFSKSNRSWMDIVSESSCQKIN